MKNVDFPDVLVIMPDVASISTDAPGYVMTIFDSHWMDITSPVSQYRRSRHTLVIYGSLLFRSAKYGSYLGLARYSTHGMV